MDVLLKPIASVQPKASVVELYFGLSAADVDPASFRIASADRRAAIACLRRSVAEGTLSGLPDGEPGDKEPSTPEAGQAPSLRDLGPGAV